MISLLGAVCETTSITSTLDSYLVLGSDVGPCGPVMKMAQTPSALVLLAAISEELDLSSTVSEEQLNPYIPSTMLMTGFDSAGTPSSTYTDASEQASRKHPACDAPTEQRQRCTGWLPSFATSGTRLLGRKHSFNSRSVFDAEGNGDSTGGGHLQHPTSF